jgi:hypothetical protein
METKDQILKDYKAAKSFKSDYENGWLEAYRQYLSASEPRYFPDGQTKRSSVFVPYAFSNVEGVVARVADIIIPNNDWFDVTGFDGKDRKDAEKMYKLLQYGFAKSFIIDKIHDFLKLWAIFGFAVAKVDWSRNKKKVVRFDKQVFEGVESDIIIPEAKEVEDNFPGFEVISPFHIFIDPAATCIDNARHVMHETELTVKQLKEGSEGEDPIYLPEAVAEVLADLGEYRDSDLVRVLEYWTDEKVCVMTLGDGGEAQDNIDEMHSYRGTSQSGHKETKKVGQHLIREEENPFLHGRKPFVGDSYTRLPNQVYGIGVVEPNQKLQETLNVMVNMIIDNWNQGVNRRYIYSRDADIDLNDFNNFNVPGGLVGVYGDTNKAVTALPSFTPAPGDYGILDLIKSMIALSSGMDDFYARGQGSARSNRTAAGIQQVIDQMGFRFKDLIKNIEQRVLKQILDMNVVLWQQFIADNEPVEVRITGQEPMVKVTPVEIYKQFDFVPVAAQNLMNKSVKLQNIAQFSQMFGQSPFVDQYELVTSYAQLIDLPPGIVFEKPASTMTQDEENLILLSGQGVPVNMWDNHQQHLQDLQKAKQSPIGGVLPDEIKNAALMAIQQHEQGHMMAMQQIQQGMISQHAAPKAMSTEQQVESESQKFSDATAGYAPNESQRGVSEATY